MEHPKPHPLNGEGTAGLYSPDYNPRINNAETIMTMDHDNNLGNGHDETADSTRILAEVDNLLKQPLPKEPEEDIETVRNCVFGKLTDGKAVVTTQYEYLYQLIFGEIEGTLRGLLLAMQLNLNALSAHEHRLSRKQNGTDPHRIEVEAGNAWTILDRFKAMFLVLIGITAIGVDLNTIATILQENVPQYATSPWRACFFSLVPLGVGACIEIGRSLCKHDSDRRLLLGCVIVLAVATGTWWMKEFASSFPSIAPSTSQLIDSLALVTPGEAAPAGSNSRMIFLSLVSATLIAGACWLYLEAIVELHRITRAVANPVFMTQQRDLNHVRQLLERQRALIKQTEARLDVIQRGRAAFIGRAATRWAQAEAALAFQKTAFQEMFGSES